MLMLVLAGVPPSSFVYTIVTSYQLMYLKVCEENDKFKFVVCCTWCCVDGNSTRLHNCYSRQPSAIVRCVTIYDTSQVLILVLVI